MVSSSRFASALVGGVAMCVIVATAPAACSSRDTTPPNHLLGGGSTSAGSGGGLQLSDAGLTTGPPAPDASGLCGNDVHTVVTNPPNVYFVFDASGSMATPASGGYTRYALLAQSASLLVQSLGPFIRVGAAVFPVNNCGAGGEVFPVTQGDPIAGAAGPTTRAFAQAIDIEPFGGTPTAATLAAIKPGLVALQGKTIVILATDGGPNCNAAITCDSDQCTNNIDGDCTIDGNCCASTGPAGPTGCLDHDATVAAAADLASAGITVYVIGIAGTAAYVNTLGDLAKAGGAPLPNAPYYYDVTDLSLLEDVFQSIAGAAISCDFTIADPPPDQSKTNVWLDDTEITQDPTNGWIWIDGQSGVELVGSACSELKAGKVKNVQIVSGCPTKVPE